MDSTALDSTLLGGDSELNFDGFFDFDDICTEFDRPDLLSPMPEDNSLVNVKQENDLIEPKLESKDELAIKEEPLAIKEEIKNELKHEELIAKETLAKQASSELRMLSEYSTSDLAALMVVCAETFRARSGIILPLKLSTKIPGGLKAINDPELQAQWYEYREPANGNYREGRSKRPPSERYGEHLSSTSNFAVPKGDKQEKPLCNMCFEQIELNPLDAKCRPGQKKKGHTMCDACTSSYWRHPSGWISKWCHRCSKKEAIDFFKTPEAGSCQEGQRNAAKFTAQKRLKDRNGRDATKAKRAKRAKRK